MKLSDTDNNILNFKLVMGKYGWCQFVFEHLANQFHINLSDVFCPFKDLIYWVDKIEKHSLFNELIIDEEGHEMTLSAKYIDNKNIQIMIEGSYENKIYLDINVNYHLFCTKLKKEIIRFFSDEFDPLHWDKYGLRRDNEEDLVSLEEDGLKEWVFAYYNITKETNGNDTLLNQIRKLWENILFDLSEKLTHRQEEDIKEYIELGGYGYALNELFSIVNRNSISIDHNTEKSIKKLAKIMNYDC